MRRARSIPILSLLGVALAAGCSGGAGGASAAAGRSRSVAPAASVNSASPAPTTSARAPIASRPSPSPAPTPTAGAPTPSTSAPAPAAPAFVQVDKANARFVLAGKPFYFAGTNAYYLMQTTAQGGTVAIEALDAAKAAGFRVIRTWGFYDDTPPSTGWVNPAIIQFSPGVYQDSALRAMDSVIAEAGKRGLHLIITFTNNWDDYGGMNQYVRWAGLSGHDLFYTDARVKQFFKNYMRDFVNRVNTITGVAYKDDPTIMSWELANEAECRSDPGALQGTLRGWYAEMAAYLKSVDPNHLVSTGEEGFDVTTSGYTSFTSYTTYFGLFSWIDGTSFTQNIALQDIDWGSIHLYPDTWTWLDPTSDGVNWIKDHVAIARAQGKPLVLAEYGLEKSSHSIYKSWLDAVLATNAAGALVWELVPASRATQVPEAFNVVYPTDIAQVLDQQAAAAALNAK